MVPWNAASSLSLPLSLFAFAFRNKNALCVVYLCIFFSFVQFAFNFLYSIIFDQVNETKIIHLPSVFCYLLLTRRYFTTAQLMLNGFLTAQGIPPHALFDPHRPSESLAKLFDFIAREHLHTKISTIVYVKPAVTYVKDLVKLGKARGLLQKFNATELSDKLTDTVNLEVYILFF